MKQFVSMVLALIMALSMMSIAGAEGALKLTVYTIDATGKLKSLKSIAVNAKKQVDMPFLDREGNAFLVEGYEGTKEIDGVSYAFGNVDSHKSMYIVGVETSNPSFMAE